MNLQTVLDYVPFYETTDIEKIKEIEIKGVQVDSRSIKDGELFVCIKGYTVVPVRLYLSKGLAKLEIALAKGKNLHDKRESQKAKDAKREIEKALKNQY